MLQFLLIACILIEIDPRTSAAEIAGNLPGDISGQLLAMVRAQGVAEQGGWLYLYGQVQPLTQSSASISAAQKRAGFEAKSRLIERKLAEVGAKDLRAVPERFKANLLQVLAGNYSGKVRLKGFATIKSGSGSEGVWVVVTGPVGGVEFGAELNLVDLVRDLLGDSTPRLSPDQSDDFYEAACSLGLPPSAQSWLNCQRKSLQTQIHGESMENIFRMWLGNEKTVKTLLTATLPISELKKCMLALPYSQLVNDTLVARYWSEGMTNCAAAACLKGFMCPNSDEASIVGINKPAWMEAVRAGDATQGVIRVILAANGKMPAKEEPPSPRYWTAMESFKTNTMQNARLMAYGALEESINADTLNLYGRILRQLGFYELGAVICRQAYTCRPSHPYALINVALCLEALSKHEEAKMLAAEVLKNDAINEESREAANKILDSK